MPIWEELGQGSYNKAYVNKHRTTVLKISKSDTATDTPERSVRLWRLINPDLPAAVYNMSEEDVIAPKKAANSISTSKGAINFDKSATRGWICPYIEGKQASDEEMKSAIVGIFNRSGRVITDAIAPRNFLTTEDGKTICIDIGMALQMQLQEEVLGNNTKREKSEVSIKTWENADFSYVPFLENGKTINPETVQTIKALLFIAANRPDIYNANFLLKPDKEVITALAQAFDSQQYEQIETRLRRMDVILPENLDDHIDIPLSLSDEEVEAVIGIVKSAKLLESNYQANPGAVKTAQAHLLVERTPNYENIKDSCVKELERYIKSRGEINQEGKFKPSWKTRIFRNQLLTATKVEAARELIDEIKKSSSAQEIKDITNDASLKKAGTKVFFSGLGAAVLKIDRMADVSLAANQATLSPSSRSM